MFWRLLARSLSYRPGRLGVGCLAVALGAALVSTLVNLSFDVGEQAERQLRAYGANIVVLPRAELGTGPTSVPGSAPGEVGIDERQLAALEDVEPVVGYVPYVYLVAEFGGRPVVVAGTIFERARALSPWWKLEGRWPAVSGEGLLGIDAALALGAGRGDAITLGYGERSHSLKVLGVLETGGPEDGQVLLPLVDAQRLAGRPGRVTLVQVSALTQDRSARDLAVAIESRIPGVEASPVRQFTRAEERVLGRLRRLVALVGLMVLGVAALTVGSTMVTRVLERRQEIGLMKALSAPRGRVAGLFLAEALGVGLAGGVLGYFGGLGLAAFTGRKVFEAALAPAPAALPITLVVAVGATLLASLWPVRRALAVDPAVTLRGE